MASVGWSKGNIRSVAGKRIHFDKKLRAEREHANKDINKDLTKNNYFIGCTDFADSVQKAKDRIKEVDEKHPPKKVAKDRVTTCMLEFPCPQEITDMGREDDFFRDAYKVMENFFGKENLCGGYVHKDEVHDYVDKFGEQKRSLYHMHVLAVPYSKWIDKSGEREGINGKHFQTRESMRSLNNAIDAMTKRNYGVDFMTGGHALKQSVETLKRDSKKLLKESAGYVYNAEIPKSKKVRGAFGKEKEIPLSEDEKEIIKLAQKTKYATEFNRRQEESLKERENSLKTQSGGLERTRRELEQRLAKVNERESKLAERERQLNFEIAKREQQLNFEIAEMVNTAIEQIENINIMRQENYEQFMRIEKEGLDYDN